MTASVALLATLYVIWGLLALLLGLSMFLLGVSAAALYSSGALDPQAAASARVTSVLFFAVAVAALVWGACHVWDGIALRRFRPTARLAALVLAALNLFSFPFGTALGIYALWVLLNDQTRTLFGRAPRLPSQGAL